MKVWVLETIGKLTFTTEYEIPIPADDEVLVKVGAAGICGSDIQRVYESGAHRMPLIIGHEFSGQVVAVGKSCSEKWLSKRVGVFPLIPCGKCQNCRNKHYEMCSHYSYLGSRTDGGFAEYALVPEWNLMELPDRVTFEQAAMLEPMAVAVHALRRVTISPEANIAVCGLGTIGQLLIMFLREMGIKNILAIGSRDAQREALSEKGISESNFCNVRMEAPGEFIDRMTGGKGADIFFECVGKNETIGQAIDLTASSGQICFVGNPYSDVMIARDVYWKILRKQLRITGTWNSSFLGAADAESEKDDWHYVLNRLANGRISPERLITHRFAMEDLQDGFLIMHERKEDYTKIMMVNEL